MSVVSVSMAIGHAKERAGKSAKTGRRLDSVFVIWCLFCVNSCVSGHHAKDRAGKTDRDPGVDPKIDLYP